jgi:hypothetical protein
MQKMSQLDERNQKILSDRQSAFLSDSTIKSGDFVRFVDGTLRRVSHVWTDARNKPDSIQTSTGGSFYIGNGYMSFSGGLYSGVDFAQFTRTDETMHGRCWFFDHDHARAGGGVEVEVLCPVWNCAELPEVYPTYYLTVLTQEQHDQTCNYWYTITKHSASHVAFTTLAQLEAWMKKNKVELTQPLTAPGTWSDQPLKDMTP